MGSWTWEVQSDTVTWSDNLFKLFGRDPAWGAPSYAEHDILYTPESMDCLRHAVEEALQHGKAYKLEMTAIHTDGTLMPCIARGQAERDSDGNVCRLFGSLQVLDS